MGMSKDGGEEDGVIKNQPFQKLLKLSWGPRRGEENQIFFSFFFIGGKI
jgi:hypothetical protein